MNWNPHGFRFVTTEPQQGLLNMLFLTFQKKILKFLGGLAVKDSALLLLWFRFNPWPENFCISKSWPKKKKKKLYIVMCEH